MPIVETTAAVDQRIVDFLNANWRPPKACALCGLNAWSIEQNIAELRFLSMGAFVVGGPVIPLIVVTCNNCGNTVFVNAIKAGWSPAAKATQGEHERGGGA